MGMWGFGVTESDDFCDVYDRFMEQYDDGFDVDDITEVILDEYLADFDADDGILHDVYFAIAKAQRQCGGVDPEILKKVTEIIESGANIEFLRELEADEEGLKQRKRNLKSFLKTLNTPCKTVKKRKSEKAPDEKSEKAPVGKKLPPLLTGGCYIYKFGEIYRSFVVLECIKDESVLCAIHFDYYSDAPDFETVKSSTIGGFGCYSAEEFFNEDQLMLLGQVDMPADMYEKMFKWVNMTCKISDFKTADFSSEFKLNISDIAKAADFDAPSIDISAKPDGGTTAVYRNDYFNKNLGDVRVSFNKVIMTMSWNKIFDIK